MVSVGDAYSERADEYVALLGAMESVHPDDRELVSAWAGALAGRIVDAGCGPGHWTHFLHDRGCDIEGVDQVGAFIDGARARFPGVAYRVGRLERLGLPDASLSGVLSWYSIIHTPPEAVGTVLGEFARCLEPGGSLLLGFFAGPAVEPFDHAVVTAYRWTCEELAGALLSAGFDVVGTHARADPGSRPHGAIEARRREA